MHGGSIYVTKDYTGHIASGKEGVSYAQPLMVTLSLVLILEGSMSTVTAAMRAIS